jgi:hypothetical protein
MTKNAAKKKAVRKLMAFFDIGYMQALDINEGKRCAFGGCNIDPDNFNDEIGEFWSDKLQDTVVAHPDCAPDFQAIFDGSHPDWKMA